MASDFGYTTSTRVGARLQTTFDGTTTPTATEVDDIISEVEAVINKYADIPYEQATATNELYDHSGAHYVTVKKAPLISVASVEYTTDGGDTWNSLTEGVDFYVDTDYGRIERDFVNGTDWIPRGRRNLRITYDYGYASVPVDIRQLATMMAVNEVVRTIVNKGANSEGGRISVGAISIDKSMFSPDVVERNDQIILSRLDKLSSGTNYTTVGKAWY